MSLPVRRNFKRDLVVWLDSNIDTSKDYANTCRNLQTIVNSVKTFSDPNACIDYLWSINSSDDLVFFIVSDSFGKDVIPLVHLMPQLHRVYIYASNRSKHAWWKNQYDKVECNVFDSMQSMYEQLKKDKKKYNNEFVAISFISKSEIRAGNRQDPSFMYNQLLKDIILNDDKNDSEEAARKQMLHLCRQYYKNNKNELQIIDEFERDFFPEHSFYWYTRDCFLYKILNKALWTPEPAILYKFRYFIRNLHQQILVTADTQSKSGKTFKVFRGQGMMTSEFNKLRNGIGGLLSFNNFLSTSLDRSVALGFAEPSKYLLDETSILFSMNIVSGNRKCPFIVVGNLGFYQNLEQEVLFSMGTVFRIDAAEKMENNQWEVQLTLTEDTDDNLAHYTIKLRKITRSSHPLISLVKLMDEMGQYKMIDVFADIFADDDSIHQRSVQTAAMQHTLGTAYLSAGNQIKALEFLENSLTTLLEYLPNDHPSLSPTYNNIGSVYHAKKEFTKALDYHQKALHCQLHASDPNLEWIVTYSMNIATIHQGLEQYNEALVHLNHALELQKQYLGDDDSALSTTYDAIARICYEKEEFETADTQKKFLLSNHPSIASTYNHLARAYYKQQKFAESIPYYQKALEIEQSSLVDDHPAIALSHFNMSTAYVSMPKYKEALECAQKAVEQLQKRPNPDLTSLGRYIRQIGHVFQQQGKHVEAIRHYEESLAVTRTDTDDDNESVAIVYNNIGDAYLQMNKFAEALSYYEKTLEIELRTLPDNAPTIAATYANMSLANLKISKYNEALRCAHDAVNQLRKRSKPDPMKLSQYLCQVGHVLRKQEKYSEAIRYYNECLTTIVTVIGNDDESLANTYYRIADCYCELKKFAEALPFYEKTLTIEQKYLEDDHPTIAVTHFKMSTIYANMSKYNEALKCAQDAVKQLQKRSSSDPAELGQYLYYLGNILLKQGQHSEAVRYFEEGLTKILMVKSKDDESSAVTYFNIGGAYCQLNKFTEALSYFQKTLEIELRTLPNNTPTIASTYEAWLRY
ncbi:unnamed protein product [Rotaria sp. Silwood2]|nr:unnamed protein product [Rotaria sp. Silwood2]